MTKTEKDKLDEFMGRTKGDEDLAFHLWLKWKCLTDLYYFGSVIMGLGDGKKEGKHVLDPKFHKWLAGVICQDRDVMVLVPRFHLKSTWVKYRVIQRVLQNPNIRIAIYSATGTLVKLMLSDLKRMIQTPLLMKLFPEIIPPSGKKYSNWEKSTENQLTMRRDPSLGYIPQEPQISTYGVGANVVGQHFDEHYYDDLVTPDTVRTAEQLQKTREWYAYIQPILVPGGKETITATPYHYNDLYTWISKKKIYDKIYRRSAIESGKTIYSFFTLKDLTKYKNRMGIYTFNCQFMCNPIPTEDMLFPPPQPVYSTTADELTYYIAVDPAATTRSHSDETAIIVAGVNKIGQIFVEKAYHFKKGGNEIARIIIELNERYGPVKIGIELGLQEHLIHIINLTKANIEELKGKNISLPIESVKFSHKSKYDRINWTLGSFMREGKVFIHESLIDLMEQMGKFNPNYAGKDDLVDALSMIFPLIAQYKYRYEGNIEVFSDTFTVEELIKNRKKKDVKSWESRFAV